MNGTGTASHRKPFLKWAGGKQRIVGSILPLLPKTGRYFEPFIGSGAVYLNMPQEECFLSDVNGDLVELYRHLQKDGEAFIEECRGFFCPECNVRERYYELRDEFNTTSDLRRKSAIFLYMNRHGFNGMCRYNASGGYNIPFGRYKGPSFPEAEMRSFLKRALRGKSLFSVMDFREALARAGAGDVVYCDPPYVPLSATASFVAYAAEGFGVEEQRALANAAREAAERGATVVISNHDTPLVRSLYEGANIRSILVRRLISCTGERNEVKEVLALFSPAEVAACKLPAVAGE